MKNNIAGDKLRGHLEAMSLAALERGDAHGFEIMRRIRDRGAGSLELREGTLYPVLYRLEERGCIRGAWEEGASRHRGPRRRIYALTPKGKRELSESRQEWGRFVKVIKNILEAPA